MTRDPARATLERALAVAEQRIESATGAIVRPICGGMPWNHELTMRARGELERALLDRWVIKRAIAELDVIDGKTKSTTSEVQP